MTTAPRADQIPFAPNPELGLTAETVQAAIQQAAQLPGAGAAGGVVAVVQTDSTGRVLTEFPTLIPPLHATATAQVPFEAAEHTFYYASNGAVNDKLGDSANRPNMVCSADGSIVIAGTPVKTLNGIANAGAVYFFRKHVDGLVERQILTHPNLATATVAQVFGRSVALSPDGNTLVIGSAGDNQAGSANAGAVFTYARNTTTDVFELVHTLRAPTIIANSQFGLRVALQGDQLLVAAPLAPVATGITGRIYFYTKSGIAWNFVQQFTTPNTPISVNNSFFGDGVALADSHALVCEYAADIGGNIDVGCIHAYSKVAGVWQHDQTFTTSDATALMLGPFVIVMRADGATAVAVDSDVSVNAGAAYILRRTGTTWAETQKIAGSGAGAALFSVALTDTQLVLGEVGAAANQIRVFDETAGSFVLKHTIKPTPPNANPALGRAVALPDSGQFYYAIASNQNNGATISAGALYLIYPPGALEAVICQTATIENTVLVKTSRHSGEAVSAFATLRVSGA